MYMSPVRSGSTSEVFAATRRVIDIMKIDKSRVVFPGVCPLLRRAYKNSRQIFSSSDQELAPWFLSIPRDWCFYAWTLHITRWHSDMAVSG